ncbi:Ctr copper transporter [Coprinopsis marcescibilis]|uniref:Copper transport protein n=1 Tax=Coprinopsis marcescibilis TaxID=230819 RepID=A0A5C3KLF9_COPMA|nr:Ctr copper transporter [Coprinopsis marcescibilis]
MPGHNPPALPKCNMHMLWNTDIVDTCIVFRSWHISTKSAFFASCIAIVLLCVFHEWLRVFQQKVDRQIALRLQKKAAGLRGSRGSSRERDTPVSPTEIGEHEDAGLLSGQRLLSNALTGVAVSGPSRILRASLYGATVFISFFLMLVFMTYNAYLIAAVVIGASLGHYIFGATLNVDAILHGAADGKGMACH